MIRRLPFLAGVVLERGENDLGEWRAKVGNDTLDLKRNCAAIHWIFMFVSLGPLRS